MPDLGNPRDEAGQPVKGFTPEAQGMLRLAYRDAARLNHRCVEAEHLLLAMIESKHPVVVKVLTEKGIDSGALRQQLVKLTEARSSVEHRSTGVVQRFFFAVAASVRSMLSLANRLPFSLRVKKVLALALKAARNLGQAQAGTEHILLGLMQEGDGSAARLLTKLGCQVEGIRKAIRSHNQNLPGQGDEPPNS